MQGRLAPGLAIFFYRFVRKLTDIFIIGSFGIMSSENGIKKQKNILVGERLKQVRISLNKGNQEQFATELGINQATLSKYEKGTSETPDGIKMILGEYGINLHWLISGEGEMFLPKPSQEVSKSPESYKIPLLRQKVSCGPGQDWDDEQNIKGYIDFFSYVPRNKYGRLIALPVTGNSMVGVGIRHGDYVLFYNGDNQYLKDDIYVFSLDGEVYCKQLEFDKISKKIKVYSIRVADIEKAELLTTLSSDDSNFNDRFYIYGRVFSWVHPNLNE